MLQFRRAVRSDKAGVFLNHQQAHADLAKTAYPSAAKGTAVGECLDRADPAAQSSEIKKLPAENFRRQLEQNVAFFLVPVIREKAVVFG